MEQKQKLKKQLTPQFCPSDEIILKLLRSPSTEDLRLGLNYLGAKELIEVEKFLRGYGISSYKNEVSGQKFLVKTSNFHIICGWYYIDIYKGTNSRYLEERNTHEIIEI